jgi:hypothetical protein
VDGGKLLMKVLIAILGLAAMLAGQAAPLQTFTSEDGVFQFKYSPKLVHCTVQRAPNGHGSGWVPADSCISQDELCDDDDAGVVTIACFAYPKSEFKNKPEFDAAAFFVARLPAETTAQACLEPAKDWQVHKTENATIGSVSGRLFHTRDQWMNGHQEGNVYRVFHGGVCYQLDIEEATSDDDVHVTATSEEFTRQDRAEVRARLKEPLDSFTFLK